MAILMCSSGAICLVLCSVLHLSFTVFAIHTSATKRETEDPGNEAALEHARQISAASDNIHDLQVKLDNLKRAHEKDVQFYEGVRKHLEAQIAARWEQVKYHLIDGENSTLEQYREEVEQQYKYKMCTILISAFVSDDSSNQKRIMDICLDRDKLALLQDEPQDPANRTMSALSIFHDSLSNGSTNISTNSSTSNASPEGLKLLLDRAVKLEAQISEYNSAAALTKERLEMEVDELRKEERTLGDQHTEHYNKAAFVREMAHTAVVQGVFCPITMQEGAGISDSKVWSLVMQNCA